MIRCHGYFRDPAAYRRRIAFELKGPTCDDFVPVHPRRGGGEKRATCRAPDQAPVPALRMGGPAPTRSPAIVGWPGETYPEPPLLPADRDLRVRVRAVFANAHPSRQPDGAG